MITDVLFFIIIDGNVNKLILLVEISVLIVSKYSVL